MGGFFEHGLTPYNHVLYISHLRRSHVEVTRRIRKRDALFAIAVENDLHECCAEIAHGPASHVSRKWLVLVLVSLLSLLRLSVGSVLRSLEPIELLRGSLESEQTAHYGFAAHAKIGCDFLNVCVGPIGRRIGARGNNRIC